jgi:phage repressor protein C with HTH and peptisase S24 domain
MSLIKVGGDSMEPTLLSGDLVLVDHSRTAIASQGGIYAISIDREILIKRLHLLYQDSKIHVISDNKQYPPQEIDADKLIINGKVIWYAREIER